MGDYQSLTRLFNGLYFFVDTRDISVAPSILARGEWEPNMTRIFLKTVHPGMTVIDIGTHLGYYTVLAGMLVGETGKVYGFEANPIMFETLFKNIFINGLIERVTIENKAVYSSSTCLKFNTLKRATGGNSIVSFSEDFKKTYQESIQTIEVEAVALDEYFNSLPRKIDVLKIDAEGSEPYIFQGMKNILNENKNITIFCEFDVGLITGAGSDPKLFLEQLIQYGFKLQRIIDKNQPVDTSIHELMKLRRGDLFLTKCSVN